MQLRVINPIEIINNKARHNLVNAKCRLGSDRLDGAVSFREPLGQTKVMQICQGETLNHQGAITHEVCCLAAQFLKPFFGSKIWMGFKTNSVIFFYNFLLADKAYIWHIFGLSEQWPSRPS